MKALFCYSAEDFRLEEIGKPQIQKDEILIEMLYTGLCGSDIVKIFDPAVKKPAIFGHEVVGRVVERGKDVSKFKEGDLVVAAHHIPCWRCHYCLHGSYSMCRHFKETNIYPGSFCQYIRLSKEHIDNTTFKIQPGSNLLELLFMEPLACCIRAIDKIKILKDDIIAVAGAGVIGILFIQLINLYGGKVIAIEPDEERRLLAKSLGAEYTINPIKIKNNNVQDEIRSIAPEGTDAAVLTVTNKDTMGAALFYIRDGGTVIIFGAAGKESVMEVDFKNIYRRELTIASSYSSTPETLKSAYSMIIKKEIKLSPLISEVLPLSDFKKGLDMVLQKKIYKAIFKL
jgi:L-iditol 2-dehydrogenase